MRWTILALVGCGGASPLTTLDELRIIDLGVEPASPIPGELPDIEPLVVDPTGEGFETWTWWCQESGCDAPIVGEPFAQVFALACAPGTCDGPGDLADPDAWLADLPLQGVTFARRTIPVSASADARLNDNPILEPVDPVDGVDAGSTTMFGFRVVDATADQPLVFGFATLGGFDSAEGRPVDGELATLEYIAPEDPGSAEIFVVVSDGLGGTASWSGVLEIR